MASFTIVLFSLIPSLLYVFTIYQLSVIKGNIDSGGIIGSYIGLLFLNAAFTAIGVFCSSITSNQVIAFLFALFLNFILFSGFETLSQIPSFSNGLDYIVSQLGMQFHYNSISRGALDTRDIVYFLSIVILFILGTKLSIEKRKW
ncbi:MAG: ABC transporter permease [Bacteroidetes bacterium OLB11]|nr:MAG: ABC transporter permease [Bacteroidetes bacterium OLB11]